MLERETKDKEEAKRGKRVQPVHDGLKQAAEPGDSQEGQALADMPVTEQAFLVRDPQVFGAQRARTMLNLQQTHGNRYVQRLAEGSREATLDEETMGRIEAQKGSGKPLEPKTRSEMEAAFNQDFGGVRIHTDANAAKLARELDAKAFTTGKDIFFREGAADLGSESGKGLLGHELAHVVQQDLSTVRGGEISKPNEPAEAEAQQAGEIISCDRQPLPIKASAAQVSRQLSIPEWLGPRFPFLGESSSGGGTQAATTTTAEAPAAEKGLDKARLAALKALWDAVIVTRVRETYQALAMETPDIKLAYGKVGEACKTTDTIRNAYPVESMSRARLTGFYLLLRAKHGELGEYLAVEKVPLAKIRDGFNPDTGDMKQWIEIVKGLL